MVRNPPIILFVDREPAWSETLRADLQRRGARVLMAQSIRELSEVTQRWMPELVVLNAGAEEMRGEALIALVRSHTPQARIVLLDAGDEDLEGVARAMGLLYCGARPQDTDQLTELITSAFPGRFELPTERPHRTAMIMCVDDDPLYLRSLERILSHHGYRVVAYDDPERALDGITEMKPDMAIVDIMMPGMNGLNLAEEIRENTRGRIPVVLLTARSSDEDILEGYRHGAAYYITKPCAPRTVLNIVDYLVGGLDRSQRQKLEVEL